ncbi:hypothetical protein HDU76_008692, partial [Blyttiomyces sp. JEL0837]
DAHPLLNKWLHRVTARPAVRAGMDVPDKSTLIDRDFKLDISPEEAAKRAAEATKWILEGQAAKK